MYEKEFSAADGRVYRISVDEEGEEIEVFLKGDRRGSITLEYKCDPPIEPDHFYIHDLSLNNCKRIGLGEAALRYHKDLFDLPIVAAKEHGPSLADGSHLIDDGINFIRRMREKGIVCPEPDEQ